MRFFCLLSKKTKVRKRKEKKKIEEQTNLLMCVSEIAKIGLFEIKDKVYKLLDYAPLIPMAKDIDKVWEKIQTMTR